MSYGAEDFVLEQGVRFDRQIELEQSDGTPFDLTGFIPRVQALRDAQVVLSTEGDTPEIIVGFQPDGQTNAFTFSIYASVTATLFQPYDSVGDLVYYVDLVDALIPDSTIRVLKGRFIVSREGAPV